MHSWRRLLYCSGSWGACPARTTNSLYTDIPAEAVAPQYTLAHSIYATGRTRVQGPLTGAPPRNSPTRRLGCFPTATPLRLRRVRCLPTRARLLLSAFRCGAAGSVAVPLRRCWQRSCEKTKPQRRPSFRSPSGSASLTQLTQADTSDWYPRTTDSHTPRPRRGRHNRRGTTFSCSLLIPIEGAHR